MKTTLLTGYVCLLSLVLISCAKEKASMVNQSTIYTSYSITYDDNLKSLYARANFNFGGASGTYLTLDQGSYVTFDSHNMSEDTNVINQVTYRWNKASLLDSDIWKKHTFYYKNTDSNVFENTVELPELLTWSMSETELNQNSGLTINWQSTQSLEQYSIDFNISDTDNSQFGTSRTYIGKQGSYTFKAEQIKQLSKGKHAVRVCLSKFQKQVEAPEEGGYMDVTTCTKEQEITIN